MKNEGKFEIQDPTAEMRSELAENLSVFAITEEEKMYLDKLRKGVFMVPSETLNTIHSLIEKTNDVEKQNQYIKLLNEVLDQGI